MRFNTSQHLRLGQQMKLAPRMIQSMEILQLSTLALEERIEQELEKNVALEIDEPTADADDIAKAKRETKREDTEGERELITDPDHAEADFERLASYERTYTEAAENEFSSSFKSHISTRNREASDSKMEAMLNTAARAEGMTEQLLRQWGLTETEDSIRSAGEFLITFIDNDGYIRTELDDMMNQAPQGLKQSDVEDAWPLIIDCLEPTGIATRDLRECLQVQLDAKELLDDELDFTVEHALLESHLDDLENNRIPHISQLTGFTIDQINAAKDTLKTLDPRPGRALSSESPSVVIPDVYIEYDEVADAYVVALFEGRLPQLRISVQYETMSKDRDTEKETRDFISENVREAKWLIEAIDQRSNTLLRVARVVVAHQLEFFEQGLQALKPLPMLQVADQLGIHVATVSRAVNGKWIQSPRGVLPLRRFFSAGTETSDGADMSWEAVKEVLREIIEAEDKQKPLGDDKLATKMQERGIKIARRTVAKYRDQLGIPAARLRKGYA